MKFPTPEDPASAPVWDNYIVAQTTQASLGLIPEHALAMGVEVAGRRVCLRFQLSNATEGDLQDIADIVDEMQDLVGDHVQVESVYEVRMTVDISPLDGVYWVFLARVDAP